MGLLDLLFPKRNNKIKEILSQGAVIIDVRTPQEFRMNKVEGSINIPLDQLNHKLGRIKKYKKPIVLCCASGSRSASAVAILRGAGFNNVHNGRAWYRVEHFLQKMTVED